MKKPSTFKTDELIYDWNLVNDATPLPETVTLFDESLRDGIQSPSVVDPPIEAKLRFVALLNRLGVQHVDIGLPGAGPRAYEDSFRLAQSIVENKFTIKAACAARTVEADILPIVDVSQKTGLEIEIMTFLGSSPIRAVAENWDEDLLVKRTATAVRVGYKAGLPVTFVTEDTTRSRPETLERLFRTAIDEGAVGLCLCDTVGHATQSGVQSLIEFTKNVIEKSGAKIRIDWHGHNDRGKALSNALTAARSGVDRVHGTALGIGERVGNTALDQLLINLKLADRWDPDISSLAELCTLAASAFEVPIPVNYPAFGKDAFRTATGVHAAAVVKAAKLGDDWLADRVYSGVPAGMIGRRQEIEIGHMSGLSNVHWWLHTRGIEAREGLPQAILARAKQTNRVLTEAEIMDVIDGFTSAG